MTFMMSVAVHLGVERSKARMEMQRILDVEKELANVGESFFLFHCTIPIILERDIVCFLPHKYQWTFDYLDSR